MFFVIEFVLTVVSYRLLKKSLNLHKSWLIFFRENILYYFLKNLKSFCGKKDAFDCAGIRAQVFRNDLISILKVKFSVAEMVKRIFQKETFF